MVGVGTLAALGVVTVVGVGCVGFGYDIAGELSSRIGWIGGAGVGWLIGPEPVAGSVETRAVVAARFYVVLLTALTTGVGAIPLGIVGPLRERALVGSVSSGGGFGAVSPAWAVLAFVAGVALRHYRHGDNADLPTPA